MLAVVAAGTVAAVATSGDDAPAASLAVDPGMAHVHGLGVDPADGTLYAATHFGVFAVGDDGSATRVGDQQDTMGFTVVGPRTFLGSGHPDPAVDDEVLAGLVESRDAGRTWTPLSLRGEADFHALVARHGRVYGHDATSGAVMVSEDRRTWDRRSRLPARDLAVSPADPEVLLATTPQGPLRSADGGRSWTPLAAPPLVVLDWADDGALYGVDVDGRVHASGDGGTTWEPRGSTGAPPEAVTAPAGEPGRLVVAASDGRIVESTDGGRTFRTRYRA